MHFIFNDTSIFHIFFFQGVECTYPCPPATSTSLLWMGGQSFAVIFLLVGDSLRGYSPYLDEPKDTLRTGLICMASVATCTTILALIFKSPNYRMDAEAQARANTANRSKEQEEG